MDFSILLTGIHSYGPGLWSIRFLGSENMGVDIKFKFLPRTVSEICRFPKSNMARGGHLGFLAFALRDSWGLFSRPSMGSSESIES